MSPTAALDAQAGLSEKDAEKGLPTSPPFSRGTSHHTSSTTCSHDDTGTTADPDLEAGPDAGGTNRRISREIRRTASNVLSQVASRLTTRSWPEPPPPPDGGLRAWTQVAMGWLVIMATWGYVNSFGSFQTYYTSTLPQSASTISWIGSVQVWLTFFVSAFSGRLLDAGLFVPCFVVGSVVQLLGIFLMSLSTTYWQLMLTQGLLTGLGGGIIFCPSLALVATYFEGRRAVAMGIVTTGNATGGMIYPVIVRELLPKLGFAWTARVLGFLNLGCLVVVMVFMRPRLPPRKSGPLIDWTAFREPVYVFFVGGVFLILWATFFTFYYIASFGTQALAMPYSQASILVILINGVGFIARLIPPIFADRIGPLNTVTPIVLIFAVVSYSWLAVHSVTGHFLFTVFYGMASGAFQCLLPTTVSSITARLDMVGTRMGMAFTIISFGALTGPPIGGALLQTEGGWRAAQAWAASATLLAFGLVAASRVSKGGWTLKARC